VRDDGGARGGTPRERVPELTGVLDRVRALLGPEGVDADGIAVPAGDEETGTLLRVAGEEGWRVLPLGAGLGPRTGGLAGKVGSPDGPDLLLSTRRRTGITRYEPADLTLTVEAGTTLEGLDREVRSQGQWLPLDPPGGDGITLGGAVAQGLGGPLVLGFGRPREHVLGLTLVDGGARTLSLGGRVVKNVAGFDLVRLAVGSRGGLGVITSLSLRLFPVPAVDRVLVWEREGLSEAWELARRLVELPLPLSAVEVVAGVGDGDPGEAARVLVRILGSDGAAERMTRELEGSGGAADRRAEGVRARALLRSLSEGEALGEVLVRAWVLPDRGGRLLETLRGDGGAAPTWIALRPGTGELRLGAPAGWDRAPLAARARDLDGSFRVLRGPGGGGSPGAAPAAGGPGRLPRRVELERGLRESFDPRGILPGAWREEGS
jgi:glycolate oxidase FAD binding subunit